jgi:hypothetical protein
MSRTAGQIIGRVRRTLVDPTGVTWTDAELLDYLTAAQTATVNAKNDAFRVVRNVPLVPGFVQQLPTTLGSGDAPEVGLAVFEIYSNVNGPACNQVGRELLNNANPNWTQATPQQFIDEWMTDTRDPSRFLVNPPNDGTGVVVALYGAIPQPLGSLESPVALPDTYETALWAYTLALAYAANTKRKDPSKEQFYLGLWAQQLGIRTQSQVVVSPKLTIEEPQ